MVTKKKIVRKKAGVSSKKSSPTARTRGVKKKKILPKKTAEKTEISRKKTTKKKASKKKRVPAKPPRLPENLSRSQTARELLHLSPLALQVTAAALQGRPVKTIQWGAAKLVLDKIVPNLKAIEVSGELEHDHKVTERVIIEFTH
jgi:hypothetical protein